MDSAQQAPSVLDTLRTVEFRLGLKGYNVDEVDEYLEKAAVEAEGLKEQMRQSAERLQQATQRIAQLEQEGRAAPAEPQPSEVAAEAPVPAPGVADDTLQRTLLLAQRFVEQTKRDSEDEANQVISRAEEEARVILNQAENRARQVTMDSEQRLREEVTRLESMRTQLAADVENLARHLEAERGRLRGSLTEMLKWLDEKVQPTASLMALRQRAGTGLDRGRTSVVSGESTNGDRRAGDPPESGSGSDLLDRRPPGGAEAPRSES